MTERQKEEAKLKKAFAGMGDIYQFIKADILDFGTINVDAPDAELGARYKAREELKQEIAKKFKGYELLN